MRLHAENLPCTGAADAPALVLLHGWGLHRGVWQPLLPWLRPHVHLTLIDLPGFGQSRAVLPAAYSLAACAELILAVAPARAHWLGWSLGGLLALYIAGRQPQRVSRLSLIACNPRFLQAADWPCAMPTADFSAFQAQLLAQPEQALARFSALQCQGAPQARADLRFLQGCLGPLPAPRALQGGLALLADSDLRALLPELGLPLQCLLGEVDRLVPASLGPALRVLQPTADLGFFAAGHLLFVSQAEACAQAILRFAAQEVAV